MVQLSDFNDDRGIIDAVPAAGQQFLGEPTVVESLVRGFVLLALAKRDEQHTGGLSNQGLLDALKAEASRLQTIFFGKDPDFKGSHWNRPGSLGEFLVAQCGVAGPPEDAVEALFRCAWLEAAPHMAEFEAEEMSEDLYKASLDEIIERYTHYLTGIPLPENYWGDAE